MNASNRGNGNAYPSMSSDRRLKQSPIQGSGSDSDNEDSIADGYGAIFRQAFAPQRESEQHSNKQNFNEKNDNFGFYADWIW